MGLGTKALFIYAFNALNAWFLGLSSPRSRPWGKTLSSSGLSGRWSQETGQGNETGRKVCQFPLLLRLQSHHPVSRPATCPPGPAGLTIRTLKKGPPGPADAGLPFPTTKGGVSFPSTGPGLAGDLFFPIEGGTSKAGQVLSWVRKPDTDDTLVENKRPLRGESKCQTRERDLPRPCSPPAAVQGHLSQGPKVIQNRTAQPSPARISYLQNHEK